VVRAIAPPPAIFLTLMAMSHFVDGAKTVGR
jgi:hypothetical protein